MIYEAQDAPAWATAAPRLVAPGGGNGRDIHGPGGAGDTVANGRLQGCRVLVVEDEPFVAMDIEAMLGELGCHVVGPVGDRDSALCKAREAEIDLALLDVNLNGHAVDDIADTLHRRGVPFAFASGYGRDGLPQGFRQAPLLEKPFANIELRKVMEGLLVQNPAPGDV